MAHPGSSLQCSEQCLRPAQPGRADTASPGPQPCPRRSLPAEPTAGAQLEHSCLSLTPRTGSTGSAQLLFRPHRQYSGNDTSFSGRSPSAEERKSLSFSRLILDLLCGFTAFNVITNIWLNFPSHQACSCGFPSPADISFLPTLQEILIILST